MPGQVFQVVQCYSCRTFQVQQKKKVNKWVCKMCGEKQSIKKVIVLFQGPVYEALVAPSDRECHKVPLVYDGSSAEIVLEMGPNGTRFQCDPYATIVIYGEGSGADCRVHVQKLNTLRGEVDSMENPWSSDVSRDEMDSRSTRCDEMDQHDTRGSYTQYQQHCSQTASRWDQYVDEADEYGQEEEELGNDERCTTDRQVYRNSLKESKKRKNPKSIFKPYSMKRNDSSMPSSTQPGPWDQTYAHFDHDFRPEIHTGESYDRIQLGNQLIHNQEQHDKTWQDRLAVSDFSFVGSVGMRNSKECEIMCMQTVNMFKTKNPKSSSVISANTSKWSSFVEDKEESDDDDSDRENQTYLTNTIQVGDSLNSVSSVSHKPTNLLAESEWSVFEDVETNEKEMSEILPTYCSSSESSVGGAVQGQTHRNVLTPRSRYLNACTDSSVLSEARHSEGSKGDDRKSAACTANGQVSVTRQPTAALFSLGDLDEEDLDLDF